MEIKQVSNGWKVIETADETGGDVDLEAVFQSDVIAVTPAEAFCAMLYYVLEQIGPSESRYDKERIYIEIRPGDKFEASEDGPTVLCDFEKWCLFEGQAGCGAGCEKYTPCRGQHET